MNVSLVLLLRLFRNVFRHYAVQRRFTMSEKSEILQTLWSLSSLAFNEFGDPGELLGQLDVPRVQHKHLEAQGDERDD